MHKRLYAVAMIGFMILVGGALATVIVSTDRPAPDCRVLVCSGGTLVREYRSAGAVEPHYSGGWWTFRDRETGRVVRVSGTVVIEGE